MSEVEKLYKNARVSCKPNYVYNKAPILSGLEYPPFTAEKQLELIKWLIREKYLIGRYIDSYYELFTNSMISYNSKNEYFEKSLAGLINNLWQDLTEEEKQEIKRILT